MAFAVFRAAVAGLGEDAVRSDAGLGMDAPEAAVIAARDGGVLLDADVLSFPAQSRAEVRMMDVETFSFVDDHASPFTKAAAGACSSRILDRSAESMFDRMLKVNDCDFNF